MANSKDDVTKKINGIVSNQQQPAIMDAVGKKMVESH